MGNSVSISIKIEGVRETLAALTRLGPEANRAIKDHAEDLAEFLAITARVNARGEGRQAGVLARTVKTRRDRLPVIVAGGNTRVGRHRNPAYKLLFGSEFGATYLRQFKPHLGASSYWFFKAVEDHEVAIALAWSAAADDVMRSFARG